MCGRFSLRVDRDDLIQQLPQDYDADVDEWIDEDEFVPRYNVAPRTQVPVIRHRDASESEGAGSSSSGSSAAQDNAALGNGAGGAPSSSGANSPSKSDAPDKAAGKGKGKDGLVLQTMKWGLVPHWSKHEDKSLNTINARAENLIEGGGIWASIKGRKRCAVPCQGYYEWQTKGKEKIPHFTKRSDGKLMLLAGLYDCAHIDGKTLWTFTIVTTDANKKLSWLHDRQPVILSTHDALMQWLDTSPQTWTLTLTKMVQPYGDDMAARIQCYAVPKEVGKVGTESPTFIEPVAERKDGIAAMFAKQESKKPASPTKSKATATLEKTKVEEKQKASGSSAPTSSPSKSKRQEASPVKVKSSPGKSKAEKAKKEEEEASPLPSSETKSSVKAATKSPPSLKRKAGTALDSAIDLTNGDSEDDGGDEPKAGASGHVNKRPKVRVVS